MLIFIGQTRFDAELPVPVCSCVRTAPMRRAHLSGLRIPVCSGLAAAAPVACRRCGAYLVANGKQPSAKAGAGGSGMV